MPMSIKKIATNLAVPMMTLWAMAAMGTSMIAWAQDEQSQQPAAGDQSQSAASQPAASEAAASDDTFTDDVLNDLMKDAPSEAPAQPVPDAVAVTPEAVDPTTPAAPTVPVAATAAPEQVPTVALPSAPKAETSQADKPETRQRGIEEIVVTATKREESLRDIPASISAFNGGDLENQGKLNLSDYIQETPGVVANSATPGVLRISMRGVSTDTKPLSPTPSPVGVFIGDTAFTDPYLNNVTPDLSAFDIASVQILKGPQGTLFGGAALSGAIRYVLQDPVQGEWQFRSFAQYNTVDDGGQALSSGAIVNVPLLKDDNLALRVGYVRRNYAGVYDNTRIGKKDVDEGGGNQFRAILAWQPTDELNLKYTHMNQDYASPNATILSNSPNGPRATSYILFEQPTHNSFGLDSLEARYDFDSVRLISLTSHIDKDIYVFGDFTSALLGPPANGYPAELGIFQYFKDTSSALAQEVRLQSTGDGTFKWIVGAYFYAYKLHFEQLIDTFANQNVSGPGSALNSILGGLLGLGDTVANANRDTSLLTVFNDAKSQERALFFDVSDTFFDRLDVSVGARFYSTFVKGGFVGYGLLARTGNTGENADLRSRIKEQGISPKFTATYHFTDEVSLYSTVSRGFRFGGLQSVPSTASNGVPPTYKSDSLWNYEMGLRTSWLENTLHADVTGFYIQYKNPQVLQSTPTINLTYYDNVGAASSQGLEASIVWQPPVDGLQLSLQGGLTDAHTTEYFKSSSGKDILPGTQMPGAAKSQYSGSVQYALPLGVIALGSSLSYTYVGKGFSDLEHNVPVNDYGATSAGLSIACPLLSMRPQLTLNVSNIFNVTKPIGGSLAKPIAGTPVRIYSLTPPRTISLRLSLDI
ncbi:MAG: TonB-dependent receptor [Pseudomonadota bacterium]